MRRSEKLSGLVLDAKYQLAELIGEGGMGTVYAARHLGTDRPVAVKVLRPQALGNAEAIARFRREARAAGRLQHPNVVNVTDFGVATVAGRDVAYLVMELLEGLTLRSMLDARGALPVQLAADILEQVAEAVDAAHAAGIVHRDLKPDNIWLVHDGRGGHIVRVLDFGIASMGGDDAPMESSPRESASAPMTMALEQADPGATLVVSSGDSGYRLTSHGSLLGTPHYMSPEQCLGADVTPASDIYSLGVVAWEMLAGSRPFRGEAKAVLEAHIQGPAPALPSSPQIVSEVVLRALAKGPQQRYGSARSFAGRLRVAAEGPGLTLRRALALYANRMPEFWRISWQCARLPVLVTLLLLAIALAAASLDGGGPVIHVALVLAAVSGPLLWAPVTLLTNSIFALVIDRLRTRPMDALDAHSLIRELRERIGLAPSAGYLSTVWHMGIFYVRCELRAPAGKGDLAFLAHFLERRPLEEVSMRSEELAAGSRSAFRRIAIAIFAALFGMPLVEAALVAPLLSLSGFEVAGPALAIGAALMPLNAALVNPLFSSALALLYFRARQALGEDVALTEVLHGRL